MKYGFLCKVVVGVIFTLVQVATATATTKAQDCNTLFCVRNNIDEINSEIVILLGKRLQYVKRAGELKKKRKYVHDQVRENAILQSVSKKAKSQGYPSSIARSVFKEILLQSNKYEYAYIKYKKGLRDNS